MVQTDGFRAPLDDTICSNSSKMICKLAHSTVSLVFTMHWYLVNIQEKALAQRALIISSLNSC